MPLPPRGIHIAKFCRALANNPAVTGTIPDQLSALSLLTVLYASSLFELWPWKHD